MHMILSYLSESGRENTKEYLNKSHSIRINRVKTEVSASYEVRIQCLDLLIGNLL